MKINPINNYQINRNQKAKAKSNTNFEGVKFKFDIRRSFDPEFFIKYNNLDSPAKVMEFNKNLDSELRELNLMVNTVKLPKILKSILFNRRIYLENENYTADINKRIWPEDTENQLADILIEAHQLLIGYEDAGQPFKEDKGLYFDYCDHLEREAYRSSWLFNCVTDLFNQGRYTGGRYKALRKVIFDLQICGCTASGR